MSAETLAWIRDYLGKVAAQDLEGANANFSDDLVAHILGRSRLAGDVSRDGMQETMRDLFESVDIELEPIDVIAGDKHAVAVVRYTVTGSGQTYVGLRTVLYRIGDGKIHELWIFDEDQRAFDAIVDASRA